MSFKESLEQGNLGELIVRNFFENQPWVRSVVDLTKDKRFQEEDVDFMIENTDRQFNKVEVKTDFIAHKTGNIVYELTTSGNIGCFAKTKADWIAYYVPQNKELHLIVARQLRNYVHVLNREPVKMGDSAEGFILSIEELQRQGIIKRTYEGVM